MLIDFITTVWTDGEIQLSNFELHPNQDVSQFLSYAACMTRILGHSENEEAVYFDLYNMHALGMFTGLSPKINNALFLGLMTGRKQSALMQYMIKLREKENEERNNEDPPLPKIMTSRGSYIKLPNPNQVRLLNLGKQLDLVAKEVAVKSYPSEKVRSETKAETSIARKETREQNKKDRDDKLEKVLSKVLRVLGISSVLRGTASAADCAQAMVTLAGLFSLNDIHEGLDE